MCPPQLHVSGLLVEWICNTGTLGRVLGIEDDVLSLEPDVRHTNVDVLRPMFEVVRLVLESLGGMLGKCVMNVDMFVLEAGFGVPGYGIDVLEAKLIAK